MKLNLTRPLALIDLETTGLDVFKDRIVQIAILKIFPDGREEMKNHKINPTIPIPTSVSRIHGIYDNDVISSPKFIDIAHEYKTFINDSDLGGYNSNKFDIPLLVEEFLRAGINFELENRNFVDAQVIFHKMEPRNLRGAYKFYCGKDLTGAHDASVDIRATYEILKAQIQRYENVESSLNNSTASIQIKNNINTLNQLSDFNTLDPTGMVFYDKSKDAAIINFGKYKNNILKEVLLKDEQYYHWVMEQPGFSLSTKKVFKKEWDNITRN
jgi:DNA polymerase-3 subunit epsilon